MARKRASDDVLVEVDGMLASAGAPHPSRWLVLYFEMRQANGQWEYRPLGQSWGYSMPIGTQAEMYEAMADDYRFAEDAVKRPGIPTPAPPAPSRRKRQPRAAPKTRPFDLQEFARAVQRIADTEHKARFGERKVFISAVWDRFKATPDANGMNMDQFKRHLVDANRADHLALLRADLIPAMDPRLVAASESQYLNATFHFIESPKR